MRRRAFTLVELLVVIGIIALLVGILMPVLNMAQAEARSTKCMSNLNQIGTALVAYNSANNGYCVPAYNLPFIPGQTWGSANNTGGPQQPMEGWCSILARDGYAATAQQTTNSIFYCPDSIDVNGVVNGQTGTQVGANVANPRGWVDWPLYYTVVGGDSEPKVAVTMPTWGFNSITRCSYWFNSYNPIGSPVANIPINDIYYSTSVGFGPDNNGLYCQLHNVSSIRNAARTIVAADGMYMGRQSVDEINMTNTRVGFRHPGYLGPRSAANAVFADGHVETLQGNQFPCAYAKSSSYSSNAGPSTLTLAQQEANQANGPTVYADPAGALQLFLIANPGAN